MKIRQNIFRNVIQCVCAFGLMFFAACAKPQSETLPMNEREKLKPYLISEPIAKYNNAPVSFEFVLNGYSLNVSAENLTENDYKIEKGVFTVYTDFFERENKKEYTFAYSLSYDDDVIDGTLSVTSVAWSDITWH